MVEKLPVRKCEDLDFVATCKNILSVFTGVRLMANNKHVPPPNQQKV